MSEFHVNVVRLGDFFPHENADTLDTTKVFDYSVIVKRGAFHKGQLAVYIPIDSVVPDTAEWHFMCPIDSKTKLPMYEVGSVPERYRVIKAKKLRGIFSQGMLAPLPPGNWSEGDDVCDVLGITKYEPPDPFVMGGEDEAAPRGWEFPIYTDIEGLRRYPNVLVQGEDVILTEKIHGANGRFVHDGKRLWVGSRTSIKRFNKNNLWWKIAIANDLEEKLSLAPMHVFFGEVYGQVQDLKYGVKSFAKFKCFDVYDVKRQRYLDHDDAVALATKVGLEWVPEIIRGKWVPTMNELCEGNSLIADNVREGFVVKPAKERWDQRVGRVILKRHGEGFMLRKRKK